MSHMEPYCGSHYLLLETGLGQGLSIVLGLAEQAHLLQDYRFFHDNLFTWLTILDEMNGLCMVSQQCTHEQLSVLLRHYGRDYWPAHPLAVQSLMQTFGTKPISHGRKYLLSAAVEDWARYDKASH